MLSPFAQNEKAPRGGLGQGPWLILGKKPGTHLVNCLNTILPPVNRSIWEAVSG